MPRLILGFVLAVLAALLPGCVSLAPGYPKEILAYDEELLGTWRVRAGVGERQESGPQREVRVHVVRREALLVKGRLAEFTTLEKQEETAPAYTITVTEAGAADLSKPRPMFEAVMLNIDGTTLLAVQVSWKTPELLDSLGWVLPVHRVFKVRLEGSTVRIATMKHEVVWMPAIQLVDPPGDSVQLPEKSGLWLVTDADRFVQILKKAVATPDCWVEEKTEIERIP